MGIVLLTPNLRPHPTSYDTLSSTRDFNNMRNKSLEVAVLGPLGTYSHEAAFKIFGHNAVYNDQSSIANVFDAISATIPLGVVPQENSIFGGVVETYDLLRHANKTFIRGEITLKVEHCLLVKKGTKLDQLTKVMSHEQALGQCQQFIAINLPGISTVKMKSTAAAAQALMDAAPDCAAICSSMCAILFDGLEILFKGIQNETCNFTRFYIIAHSPQTVLPPILESNRQMKALFRVSSPSIPSSSTSCDITACLTSLNLSVIRIDRRPSLDAIPFHSVYFIEVHHHFDNQKVLEPFESWTIMVEKSSSRVKNLGWKSALIGVW